MKLSGDLAWPIEFDPKALAELKRLGQDAQKKILRYLRQRVSVSENPLQGAKPLRGDKAGLWRFRIGSYRVIVLVENLPRRIRVLRVGHRREVYLER